MNTPAQAEDTGPKANRRGAARLAAVQALYQMDVAGTPLPQTLGQFETTYLGGEIEGERYLPADAGFFRELVAGVVAEQKPIDRRIDTALVDGWPLTRVDLTLRAILRAGAYELAYRDDVPLRVVISEYVDVARAFFDAGDEPRIVNAVLDRLGREARGDQSRHG